MDAPFCLSRFAEWASLLEAHRSLPFAWPDPDDPDSVLRSRRESEALRDHEAVMSDWLEEAGCQWWADAVRLAGDPCHGFLPDPPPDPPVHAMAQHWSGNLILRQTNLAGLGSAGLICRVDLSTLAGIGSMRPSKWKRHGPTACLLHPVRKVDGMPYRAARWRMDASAVFYEQTGREPMRGLRASFLPSWLMDWMPDVTRFAPLEPGAQESGRMAIYDDERAAAEAVATAAARWACDQAMRESTDGQLLRLRFCGRSEA